MESDNLIEIASKWNLTFPATRAGYDNSPWRSGFETKGHIPSFDLHVKLLATNGTLAWFGLSDGTAFWGHLANFKEEGGTSGHGYSWKKSGKAKEPTERQKVRKDLTDED